MAGWSGLSAAARGAVLVTGAVVVAVLGYFGLDAALDGVPPHIDEPAGGQHTVGSAVSAPAAVSSATPPAGATDTVSAPDAPNDAETATVTFAPDAALPATEVILPRFDVARVTPDGAATVAGAAAPGATVSLMLDGEAVAQAQADGQGKFAALFDLPPSAVPRLLSLQAVGADGAAVLGAETVALAPVVGVVGTADPVEPAVQAPTAVLVAPEGVKVLQQATAVPAEVAANVALDSISYAPGGAVMLGGRAQASAALRIYLDGAAIADVAAGADGAWATTLGDVAAGIYTLRVDQLGADGKVTSRFETPFKRETLQALAAASAPVAKAVVEPALPATEAAQPAVVAPAATQAAATDTTDTVVATVAPTAAEPVLQPAADPAPAASDAAEPVIAMSKTPDAAKPTPVSVTVQPGYTLWGIAQQNFGDGVMYVQVFNANKDKIKDPNLIYPGQVFTIPVAP